MGTFARSHPHHLRLLSPRRLTQMTSIVCVLFCLQTIHAQEQQACSRNFLNEGNFDGASGWVRFDVGAGDEVGFAINAFRFVADLDGLFEIANVNVYNGSFFSEDRELVADLVEGYTTIVTAIAGEVFELKLPIEHEVLPGTTTGVEINFRGLRSGVQLCRFSWANQTLLQGADSISSGDVAFKLGTLAVSAGEAVTNDTVINNVVYHGGVCISTIGGADYESCMEIGGAPSDDGAACCDSSCDACSRSTTCDEGCCAEDISTQCSDGREPPCLVDTDLTTTTMSTSSPPNQAVDIEVPSSTDSELSSSSSSFPEWAIALVIAVIVAFGLLCVVFKGNRWIKLKAIRGQGKRSTLFVENANNHRVLNP